MPIRVECPACEKFFEAPNEYRGRETRCLHCGEPAILVPNTPAVPNKSLVSCKDCGKSISVNAKACPGCGAPIETKSEKVAKSLVTAGMAGLSVAGLLMLMVFFLALGSCGDAIIENPALESLTAPPVVTLDEYNRLQDGMSYREAVAVIGAEGKELSSSTIDGVPGVMPTTKTVMYMWDNGFANMNAMFQNDKLINKAQFGLR